MNRKIPSSLGRAATMGAGAAFGVSIVGGTLGSWIESQWNMTVVSWEMAGLVVCVLVPLGGGKVWLLDVTAGTVKLGLDTKSTMSFRCLAFTPDRKSALTCDFMAEQVQLWDIQSGNTLAKYAMTSRTKIWHPALSPDLKRIAGQQRNLPVILHLRLENP